MTINRTWQIIGASLLLVGSCSALTACSEDNVDKDDAVTTQGTVDLDKIKLGTGDQVFQEAVVTFVRDLSAQANAGGKRQYLSRAQSLQGGQYMAQVKDGICFEITVFYSAKPISREAAEAAMKNLLPADAPPQSRVDDQTAKPGGLSHAIYYFGDDYLGDLTFTDKSNRLVSTLKVSNISLLRHALADTEAQKESLKPLVDKAHEQHSGKSP